MKKLFLLLCFVFISSQVNSQVLEENFDYPAGDSVQQHGWITIGTIFTNQLKVTSPGLVYADYSKSDIGNACTIDTTGEDVYKNFSSKKTTGSIYASFMVNVSKAKSAGDYFLALISSFSTTNFYGRVYARDVSGSLAFGISKFTNTLGPIVYSSPVYSYNTTYLLVLKYTINAGLTDDSASIFVLTSGVPAIEPAPTVGPVGGGSVDSTNFGLGRLALRQGTAANAPKLIIDGITVTSSWGTVLPVELSAFSSNVNRRDVNLIWTTTHETNNSGFEIERATNINGDWSNIGFVSGVGNSSESQNYLFTDRGLNNGNYRYRLKQIDYNGFYEYHVLSNEVVVGLPNSYDLSQNYPNPFNPSTKINYDLPFDGKVSIKIFDMTGKEVSTIVNEFKTAGYYTSDFNASDLGSGVYFYTISAGNFSTTKKMMLIK